MISDTIKPHLYAIGGVFLFSTIEVVSRLIRSDVTPFAITAWRFGIGSIMLLPFALIELKKNSLVLKPTDFFHFAGNGILLVCISMLFLQLSVFYGKAALSALLVSSNPVFVTIFALLFLKEQIERYEILSLFMGILGLILVILGNSDVMFTSPNLPLSIMFGIVASLTFGIYTIYSKRIMSKNGNFVTLSFSFLCGAIVLAIFSFLTNNPLSFKPSVYNLVTILYLSLFVTGIAYVFYFQAIKIIGAAKASVYFFLKPVITLFLAWLILSETYNIIHLFGALLIVASIINNAFWQRYGNRMAKNG